MDKIKVLFVDTDNSVRSQMAEGILRTLYSERSHPFSAGTVSSGIHPAAVKVMREIGIDISAARSKKITEFFNEEIDYIVTMDKDCDCSLFPSGTSIINKRFFDPQSYYGKDRLDFFRKVRDEIFSWVEISFPIIAKGEKRKCCQMK